MRRSHARRQRARREQVPRRPAIGLRQHADLVPPADGDDLVSATVGPQGQLVSLWTDGQGREVLSSSDNQRRSDLPGPAVRVVEHWPAPVVSVTVAGLGLASPTAQPLPDGKTLIVGARHRGQDHNAAVYNEMGALVLTGRLGDGIEHVRTTSVGDIWVAYFDEGVYGDDPLGGHGLVRFTADLEPSWRYSAPGGIDSIDDCYALTVTNHEVWACYYSSFPVVRIRDGRATGWHSGRAAHALLAYSDTIALAGGYGAERDVVAVGALTGDRLRVEREFRLTLPDGTELPKRVQMFGHGDELHVLADTAWHKISLDDLHT
ncbi:MAG TPA: hypothetical protein VE465_16575 [Streptosporangiaceae bacterium]|nr:hypothetical protein [Streptosporangiaceae bacterium]